MTQALAQRRNFEHNPPEPAFEEVKEHLYGICTLRAASLFTRCLTHDSHFQLQRPASLSDFAEKDEHIYLLASEATHGIANLPLQCAVSNARPSILQILFAVC